MGGKRGLAIGQRLNFTFVPYKEYAYDYRALCREVMKNIPK